MALCSMCYTKLIRKNGEMYCPNCQIGEEDFLDGVRYGDLWDDDEDEEDEDEE